MADCRVYSANRSAMLECNELELKMEAGAASVEGKKQSKKNIKEEQARCHRELQITKLNRDIQTMMKTQKIVKQQMQEVEKKFQNWERERSHEETQLKKRAQEQAVKNSQLKVTLPQRIEGQLTLLRRKWINDFKQLKAEAKRALAAAVEYRMK